MSEKSLSSNRRSFLVSSAAVGAAALLATKAHAASEDRAIRPFHVNFPEEQLVDLRRRVKATLWPDKETVTDASQGVQLVTMQKLAQYWANEHDWRKCEAKINAVPNFITEINGLDIHFIHVRSMHENALPMIVTHGWPGSIIEQMKIIDPLTNPTAHGGTAADAFHLVIPSLPGYGFSGKPTAPGWNPVSIAKAWATLMQRLGYTKYVAQGGDWGNAVSEVMALQQPPGLLGIHTNMAATVPPDVSKALSAGGPPPAGLSPEEKFAWDGLDDFYKNGLGYANEMALRPQTLYGLVDSPVGLAGWILDHDIRSYQMIARVFDGKPEGLSRDDVLDNITLYWLTNTAVSSARLYWDTKHNLPAGGFFDVRGVRLPVGVSAFAEEIYQAPKSWSEKAYVKLLYYSKHPKGSHFAAWEQPALFVSDVRATFKSLRQAT
jgi:pimeloyl-ACP methyl ester carboxylesterase